MVYEIKNLKNEKLNRYLLNQKKELQLDEKKHTYVYEENEQILGFIQFEDNKKIGEITNFDYLNGFDYVGKELLLIATKYFYIFHLEPRYVTKRITKKNKLLKEFRINIFKKAK